MWKGNRHRRLARTEADEVALVPCTTAAVPGEGVGVVFLDVGNSHTVGRCNALAGITTLDDVGVADAMAVRGESCSC